MQIKTVRKNIDDFVDTLEYLVGDANPGDEKEKAEVIEMAESIGVIVEWMTAKADKVEVSNKKRKRLNRLSTRIFKQHNYNCDVCGTHDASGVGLSRIGLIKSPTKDEHYVVLCKKHAKEFSKLLHWGDRGDGTKSYQYLKKMALVYGREV